MFNHYFRSLQTNYDLEDPKTFKTMCLKYNFSCSHTLLISVLSNTFLAILARINWVHPVAVHPALVCCLFVFPALLSCNLVPVEILCRKSRG